MPAFKVSVSSLPMLLLCVFDFEYSFNCAWVCIFWLSQAGLFELKDSVSVASNWRKQFNLLVICSCRLWFDLARRLNTKNHQFILNLFQKQLVQNLVKINFLKVLYLLINKCHHSSYAQFLSNPQSNLQFTHKIWICKAH